MKKFVVLLLVFGILFAQSAYIINNTVTGSVNVYAADVYNDGTYMYIDMKSNPDLGLRLCSAGQKYVGATYAANVGGSYVYYTVSWQLTEGANNTLVYTSLSGGGAGCYYTPIDAFAFSQFKDFSRNPNVFVSAFPGRIHVLYSDNVNGSSPSFVFVNYSNGWLQGSYTVPLSTSSFNQSSGNVTANITSITMQTATGSVSFSPSDPKSGLNASTGRSILMALCSDDYGASCSAAVLINSSSQLPARLPLNAPTNDQLVYYRYVVVNGLGYGPICIGADITPGISVNPGTVYPNNSTNVTITLTNTGNVNITTDFILTLNITGPLGFINQTNWTITENIAPGGSVQRSINFSNTSRSGTYTFTAIADPLNQIAECNEANTVNGALTVIKTYAIHVLIDGVENDTFEYAGRAYNVTVYVNDSDGNVVPSSTFELMETNGLNPFTPTQVYNDGGYNHSVKSYSIGLIQANSSGYAMLAVIPTCNKFYDDPIRGPILLNNIGPYNISVRAYGTGFDISKALAVTNKTCADPGWVNNKDIINKIYVQGIYDWLYEIFAILKKLLVP